MGKLRKTEFILRQEKLANNYFIKIDKAVEFQVTCIFMFVDCKLARAGPPATIVPIDEESRNGECDELLMTFFLFIS